MSSKSLFDLVRTGTSTNPEAPFVSLIDLARNTIPEEELTTPLSDNENYHTPTGHFQDSTSPVASPLLNSAFRAIGSPIPTSQPLNLTTPLPVRPINTEDDGLRPMPQRINPIPPVVHRSPARTIEELETRAAPPLYPQEQASQLSALRNSLFGFLGRIPGMQTLGNLALAVPGTETTLIRLGLVSQNLPGPTAPRLAQINQIDTIEEVTPDHIAIDIPPGYQEEVPAPTHSFRVIAPYNPSPTMFSQVATSIQEFMTPEAPLLPTHQKGLDNRSAEIYQQLGIQPRLNPLAPILRDDNHLRRRKFAVAYSGATQFGASAQANRDILHSPTFRGNGPQLSPYEHWHQTAPVEEASALVDPAKPTLLESALTIGSFAVHGMAQVLNDPHQAGQNAKAGLTDFLNGFNGEPTAPQQPIATGLDLTEILPGEEAPTVAPSLMETATTLLGGITRVVQNPHQAGRDIRSGVGALVSGLTGGERKDPRASTAAPEETTTEGFFSGIFTGLKTAAMKKITEVKLAGLCSSLAQKIQSVDESPGKNQIKALIAAIERFQREEISVETLEADLTRIMNGLDASGRDLLHIHLNGFELPIRTEGTGKAQEILEATQAAHPRSTAQPNRNRGFYEQSVRFKQSQLVNNLSTMAPMNIVNERICGQGLPASSIAEILGKAHRTSKTYQSDIRKAFYKELDKLPNLSFLGRCSAKIAYWVLSGLSSIVLSSFIKGFLEKIQTSVEHDTAQQQQKLHNEIISGINEALDAYNVGVNAVKAARTGRPADGIIISDADTMLGHELARPPYNDGKTKEALYKEAIDQAVKKILPPLQWTSNITKSFNKFPLFVRVISFLPFSLIAWPVVSLAEVIANRTTQFIITLVVKWSNILDTVISLSVDQISRNGYSHAMNKLILEQLKLIGEALDKTDSSESAPSFANQNELRKVAKNLFKTLETQRRESQVDIDAVTTLENLKRSVYQMTSDFSADAIALIIDQGKNIILDPNMIAMRQDAILEALNAALESNTAASEQEMIQVEDEIKKQSDIILNKALKKIVHKTFQNTPKEVEKACKSFTDNVKKTADKFATRLELNLYQASSLQPCIAEFTETMRALLNEAQNDPILENYAGTIDQFVITPVANLLSSVGLAITTRGSRQELELTLDALRKGIENLPEISLVNTTIMGNLMGNIEKMTSKTAFIAGKEFFNQAWALLTKKPVWRFAVHRAMLGFIKK